MSETGSVSSARGRLPPPPATLRKSCDLCHQAKQKCSQHKPSCLRCRKSGWKCMYTARARRTPKPRRDSFESTPVPDEPGVRARRETNGSDAETSGFDFLSERREEPEAGPSRQPKSPAKRPHKRRKGVDSVDVDVTFSYSEGRPNGTDKVLSKPRGQGGNGFVRRDTYGKELLMTANEYMRCIRADGHLDSLDLAKFLELMEPEIRDTPTPKPGIVIALPVPQREIPEIDRMIMESISEESPGNGMHVHSDPYDELPFEEERPDLDTETAIIQEDESPPHEHFAVEESADMRYFARSNSMPPISSLPPLEMTSMLASQAVPYSPRSHYLTEGLDLAASNRTPTASTFDEAMALVRPTASHSWNIPMPRPYDPQTIIAQSQYASSPLTPPVESRGTRPYSEMSSTNWEFVGLGQAGTYRSHSSLQRAHSVPQSPYPTQHFGSIPHLPGPMSVVDDFGMRNGTDFPAPSPYAVEMTVQGRDTSRHGQFLASSNGLLSTRDSPDVDVEMSGLLNTEMEEDENGVRQVTVVNLQPEAPAAGAELDDGIDIVCHHEADISHALWAADALGSPENMSLVGIFPQLTRALEVLLAATVCPKCATSSAIAIGQLALLSRTCEILRYPHPITPSPLPLIIAGGRTTMTGLAPEIEVHIIDVVWATWRGSSIQKICAGMKKQAKETLVKVAEEEMRRKAQREEVDELGDDDDEFEVEGVSPQKARRSQVVNAGLPLKQVKDSPVADDRLKTEQQGQIAKFVIEAIDILSRIPSK